MFMKDMYIFTVSFLGVSAFFLASCGGGADLSDQDASMPVQDYENSMFPSIEEQEGEILNEESQSGDKLGRLYHCEASRPGLPKFGTIGSDLNDAKAFVNKLNKKHGSGSYWIRVGTRY